MLVITLQSTKVKPNGTETVRNFKADFHADVEEETDQKATESPTTRLFLDKKPLCQGC